MTVLQQGFREMPQRLYIVYNDDLKTAFRMAAENTKCIREQYNYNPKEDTMRVVKPEQDETITMAESQTM